MVRRRLRKCCLIRRPLVGVAGRDGDPVDAHLGHRVEEPRHPLGLGGVEQRGVDVDPEAARLGEPDGLDRAVVNARPGTPSVVVLAVAIEMHGPGEERVGLEQVDLLFKQQRVGAQVDELLARDDALDDLLDLAVQQRLAAGDHDDRRAAFVDRFEAFRDAEALVQDRVGVIDLAAAGAGQVAAEQRLQHQHERVASDAAQMLPHDVGADTDLLVQWDGHGGRSTTTSSSKCCPAHRERPLPHAEAAERAPSRA